MTHMVASLFMCRPAGERTSIVYGFSRPCESDEFTEFNENRSQAVFSPKQMVLTRTKLT